LLGVLLCLLQVLSCKKDSNENLQQRSYSGGILSFSVSGELIDAVIDTSVNAITITLPHTLNLHNIAATFTLASGIRATVNNAPISSGSGLDFSNGIVLTVTSDDKKYSRAYRVIIQTDLVYFGLTGNIVAEKSIDKDYDYYRDQFDGSTYQAINCGPTVSTMAIKWADSTFAGSPAGARLDIPENGGWWFTSDVQNYLSSNGINNAIVPLSNLDSLVKVNIDNNNLMILCLDMSYVPYNGVEDQHIQKFYQTEGTGWGHFLLVKGYKQTTTNFYLEIYDPYSDLTIYKYLLTKQLKGKNRYYMDGGIKAATDIWWQYTIVVAPKGQQVVTASRLHVNSLQKIPVARGR
jgi:hypothetical protein